MPRESYIVTYVEDNICFNTEVPLVSTSYNAYLGTTNASYDSSTGNIMAVIAVYNNVGSGRKIQLGKVTAYSLFGGNPNISLTTPAPTKISQFVISAATGGTTLTPTPMNSATSLQAGLEARLYPDSITTASATLRGYVQQALGYPQIMTYILSPGGSVYSPGTQPYTNVVAHQADKNLTYTPQFLAGTSKSNTQGLVLNQNEGFALYSQNSLNSKVMVSVTITNNSNTFIIDCLVPNLLIPSHGCFFSILNTHVSNKFTIMQVSVFESITRFCSPEIMIMPIESYSGGSFLTPTSLDSSNTLSSGIKVMADCYVDFLGNQYGGGWSPRCISRVAMPIQEGNAVGALLPSLSYIQKLYTGSEIEILEGQGVAIINTGSPVQGRYEYSILFTTTSSKQEISYVS